VSENNKKILTAFFQQMVTKFQQAVVTCYIPSWQTSTEHVVVLDTHSSKRSFYSFTSHNTTQTHARSHTHTHTHQPSSYVSEK